MNKQNDILIINDFTGCGKVSTAAMIPVLAGMGFHTYHLPTAIVSNTLDYGRFEILDTTDFMRGAVNSWKDLGFSFPNISVGLINSDEQVEIISGLIESQDSPFVLIDPIMGENGVLYDGMYQNVVECNRRLAAKADVFIPNLTEAEMLADMYIGEESLSDDEYAALVKALFRLGPGSIVITGCRRKGGTPFNLIASSPDDAIEFAEYEMVPVQFIGTGDLFSAFLLGAFLKCGDLARSVSFASSSITRIIRHNLDNPDRFDIHFEDIPDLYKF